MNDADPASERSSGSATRDHRIAIDTGRVAAPPKRPLRGLYAVTPDCADDDWLAAAVAAAIQGGASAVQYRNKLADTSVRTRQAARLVRLCHARGVPLIVNDAIDIARACGAAGVHLGRDDPDPARARAQLGPDAIIGVSCYDEFERAERLQEHADYVAFGSLFGSTVKPDAAKAPLQLLARAAARGWNVVGIGGIDVHNVRRAIDGGADAVAVITAVFGKPPGAGQPGHRDNRQADTAAFETRIDDIRQAAAELCAAIEH